MLPALTEVNSKVISMTWNISNNLHRINSAPSKSTTESTLKWECTQFFAREREWSMYLILKKYGSA